MRVTLPPPDAQDLAIVPYATEVGKLTLEWNKLHEYLGLIFTLAFRPHYAPALAAWHSLKSDLAQRDMLRSVIDYTVPDKDRTRQRKQKISNSS
jgi:hypothetical protein